MIERLPSIRHLVAFSATVEHGTVTKAAKSVNLTQPALTQAIARLESHLGCQLFEREPGGMRPTTPARLLAQRAATAIDRIGSNRVTATQMRAFIALARGGSYAAAAQQTGLAPASLHRAVADLTIALGETLVERRGRHLALTRKGAQRARNFGLALAEIRSGYAEVSGWLGKAGGRIVIGAMPLSRARWLPQAILKFAQDRVGIDIAVIEGSYSELSGPLRDGEIDFLLGALRQEEAIDDLQQQPVFEDRLQIMMRSRHPLADADMTLVAELAKYQWVLPDPQTPLYRYWVQMMVSDGGEAPHVAIECGSVLTIREILLGTDMLTLLSPDQLRVEMEADLLIARKPPIPVTRTIGITTRQDWRPTQPQAKMLETLRTIGQHIL